MSAIDDARKAKAAIRDNTNYGDGGIDNRVLERIEDALEALIAEHERVLAEMHARELQARAEAATNFVTTPTVGDAVREVAMTAPYSCAWCGKPARGTRPDSDGRVLPSCAEVECSTNQGIGAQGRAE